MPWRLPDSVPKRPASRHIAFGRSVMPVTVMVPVCSRAVAAQRAIARHLLRRQQSPLMNVFVNVGPFWDALRLVLPYEADPILAALGIQRVEGFNSEFC